MEGWQVGIRQYNGLYFYTVEHSWRGNIYEAFRKAGALWGGVYKLVSERIKLLFKITQQFVGVPVCLSVSFFNKSSGEEQSTL